MTAATSIDLSFLAELGLEGPQSGAYNGTWLKCSGEDLEVRTPATGEVIGVVKQATVADYEIVAAAAQEAYLRWRELPAPLSAPLGVWFVLGNCDWAPTVTRVFEGAEVRLLRNSMERVSFGGWNLLIAGADFGRRANDFVRELETQPIAPDELLLLVSHYPDSVLELPADSRVDLTVAGHTHGGQVNVPLFVSKYHSPGASSHAGAFST